jgi:hypothetical protein
MRSSELIRCGLPKNPVRHWGQFAMDCLNKSKAKVVLIACEAATLTYLDHIREEGVNHTLIWIFGTRRYESKDSSRDQRLRSRNWKRGHIEIVDRHRTSRGFHRRPFQSVGNAQRTLCVPEWLADLAIAIVYNTTSPRCLLSSLAQYSAVARK